MLDHVIFEVTPCYNEELRSKNVIKPVQSLKVTGQDIQDSGAHNLYQDTVSFGRHLHCIKGYLVRWWSNVSECASKHVSGDQSVEWGPSSLTVAVTTQPNGTLR